MPQPAQELAALETAPERKALPHQLQEFLVELATIVNRLTFYPPGHPVLNAAFEHFSVTLQGLLASKDTLTLGVARQRFVIDGVASDPKSAILCELAERLSRHQLAAIRFRRGAQADELSAALKLLAADERADRPVGTLPAERRSWEHVHLYPVSFGQLELREGESGHGAGDDPRAAQLWVDLARAALASSSVAEAQNDPVVVAKAINGHQREAAYDQVVVGYLMQIGDELKQSPTTQMEQLRHRVSKMVHSLDRRTLDSLLEMGGDHRQRRQFVMTATQGLAADAVLDVVQAAARASQQTVSHSLLRIMSKLARHAERGPKRIRGQAAVALRSNVQRLLDGWDLEDPNPTGYGAVLEGMASERGASASDPEPGCACEPERVLQMALEVSVLSGRVEAALDDLLRHGRLRNVVALLRGAPANATVDMIWRLVAVPDTLRRELARPEADFTLIEMLAGRMGGDAAVPLLDELAVSQDRSTRWSILKLLTELGPSIAPLVAARLTDSRWYVQRNMLVLLDRWGEWPEGFSPVPFASHAHERVRREAIKLMLDRPELRTQAIVQGVKDSDPAVVQTALRQAVEGCPAAALVAVRAIVDDSSQSPELRSLAIRAMASVRVTATLERLLDIVKPPRPWYLAWLGRRLAPKGPELLAALTGLQTHWRSHPRALGVLLEIRQHADPEIRAATETVHP